MIRVGIVGISGYTGLELVKMIVAHPYFELSYAGASSSGVLSENFSSLKGVIDIEIKKANADEIKSKCDLVFLALPHTEGMKLASALRSSGVKIVDLSADYRVSQANYEKNYCPHLDPKGLEDAVYGLVEINRNEIKNANLIANPGCYPTCSLLGLLPFANMLKSDVMIDAKSGLSGAGKGLKSSSHFISVNENMNAYSPLTHRHSDEISEHLNLNLSQKIDVMFVPHLIPLSRGMLVSSYGFLNDEFKDIDPLEILKEFYKDEKFIRIRREPVSIKDVAGTHFCDIYAMNHNGKIWINSSIDNLLRGASSQAIANANLIMGIDESTALPIIGNSI